MTLVEMREQLKELSLEERLLVAEIAIQLIREDIMALRKSGSAASQDCTSVSKEISRNG